MLHLREFSPFDLYANGPKSPNLSSSCGFKVNPSYDGLTLLLLSGSTPVICLLLSQRFPLSPSHSRLDLHLLPLLLSLVFLSTLFSPLYFHSIPLYSFIKKVSRLRDLPITSSRSRWWLITVHRDEFPHKPRLSSSHPWSFFFPSFDYELAVDLRLGAGERPPTSFIPKSAYVSERRLVWIGCFLISF